MEIQINSQRIVEALILLVLFGSTIFQSYQPISTSAVIHDVELYATSFATNIANQYQNVTYEGDLLVSNNETFTIQDSEFYMIGKITVQDTSTLIIQNSRFTAIPTSPSSLHGESIIIENQANLLIINATLISKRPDNLNCRILAQNDAEINITYSTFQKWWTVQVFDNSVIHVNNSTIVLGLPYDEYSGVGTSDTSIATIENSTMDGVFVWGNSNVSIENSVVGLVRAGDVTDVNIADSEIGAIEAWGLSWEEYAPTFVVQGSTVTWRAEFRSNSSGRFTSSSVAEVVAYGNANILLIDSYAGSIETHDDATVFVGWHLPLFGLVTMHYTWIPIIQMIIAITIIAITITVLVFLLRKRARRIQGKNARL